MTIIGGDMEKVDITDPWYSALRAVPPSGSCAIDQIRPLDEGPPNATEALARIRNSFDGAAHRAFQELSRKHAMIDEHGREISNSTRLLLKVPNPRAEFATAPERDEIICATDRFDRFSCGVRLSKRCASAVSFERQRLFSRREELAYRSLCSERVAYLGGFVGHGSLRMSNLLPQFYRKIHERMDDDVALCGHVLVNFASDFDCGGNRLRSSSNDAVHVLLTRAGFHAVGWASTISGVPGVSAERPGTSLPDGLPQMLLITYLKPSRRDVGAWGEPTPWDKDAVDRHIFDVIKKAPWRGRDATRRWIEARPVVRRRFTKYANQENNAVVAQGNGVGELARISTVARELSRQRSQADAAAFARVRSARTKLIAMRASIEAALDSHSFSSIAGSIELSLGLSVTSAAGEGFRERRLTLLALLDREIADIERCARAIDMANVAPC